ncbi:hypothetical protein Leryth_026647 [Lithospermum erythrorhizon]|nr:hypothetical protein Leryth_026647 [Lithospermum erythrorhizon]
MDPEQMFIRVQERFSEILKPRIRATLEYMYLFLAITLFCILVVMHANYVQQPGCSSELSKTGSSEGQLIQIKITSAGLWSQNESEYDISDNPKKNDHSGSQIVENTDGSESTILDSKLWLSWMTSSDRKGKSPLSFWTADNDFSESQTENSISGESSMMTPEDAEAKINKEVSRSWFSLSPKESLKAAIIGVGRKWHGRLSFVWKMAKKILGGLWDITGIHLDLDIPKWLKILHLDRLTLNGPIMTPAKKSRNDVAAFLPDYLVTKCGVLMMSLFVFFTTTMSVSFTLRETQTRMLKFTVQLQHHARHRLPTFQLIFVHVIESLVFVPIMIGILFFLFEFYDDQLLAFMVLILVWLCELFTLISVRTPISMKFFPRFFLLYFLVFHIYFFSYAYGFSYLALSTAAAFMLHLILYFWNRFEVPALQRFIQNRRSHFQQNPEFHITSNTILASTLHIRRLNTRNPAAINTEMGSAGPSPRIGNDSLRTRNGETEVSGFQDQPDNVNPDQLDNHMQVRGQPENGQPEAGANPGTMNSFSSLLLWILGGAASSEGINSFLSIFRDLRDHGHLTLGSPRQENQALQNTE